MTIKDRMAALARASSGGNSGAVRLRFLRARSAQRFGEGLKLACFAHAVLTAAAVDIYRPSRKKATYKKISLRFQGK